MHNSLYLIHYISERMQFNSTWNKTRLKFSRKFWNNVAFIKIFDYRQILPKISFKLLSLYIISSLSTHISKNLEIRFQRIKVKELVLIIQNSYNKVIHLCERKLKFNLFHYMFSKFWNKVPVTNFENSNINLLRQILYFSIKEKKALILVITWIMCVLYS